MDSPHIPEQRYSIYKYLLFLYFRAASTSYVQVSPKRSEKKGEQKEKKSQKSWWEIWKKKKKIVCGATPQLWITEIYKDLCVS